jgi:hypothetical protein
VKFCWSKTVIANDSEKETSININRVILDIFILKFPF